MLDLGWSDVAWRDGQQVVTQSGELQVLRITQSGPILSPLDVGDSRVSLRWMLFHHVRDVLRQYWEWRPEYMDWPQPYASPVVHELIDQVPPTVSFPRGPVHLSAKSKRSVPVRSRDFSSVGAVDREPSYRVMTCHGRLGGEVEVWRDIRNQGRALYHGVIKCGDYWRCPICSHRITMGRRAEIADIYNQVAGPGQGVAYLVTFTVPHHRSDRLEDLLRQMLYARDRLADGAWGKSLTRPAGKTAKTAYRLGDMYIGRMRTLEITWSSANGWHPHLHEMWVFDREVPHDRRGLFDRLPEAWADACEDWWLRRPGANGVDLRRMYSNAEYLSKFGAETRSWGPEYELAAGHGKTRTVGPWTLLENSMYGDEVSRLAFVEYAHALKAVSPSSVHVGGRLAYAIKQLGLTASDDMHLSARLGSDAELLGTLSSAEFRLLAQHKGYEMFLRLVESAGHDCALEWLRGLSSRDPSSRLFV